MGFELVDRLMAVERRLAEATGPDRELEAELCAAAGFRLKKSEGFGDPIDSDWLYCVTQDGRGWSHVPRYTSSIDAALTLVPSDDWDVGRVHENGFFSASVGIDNYDYIYRGQSAAAPAIALCLAAIFARIHVAQATAADQDSTAADPTQASAGPSRHKACPQSSTSVNTKLEPEEPGRMSAQTKEE